MAAIPGFLDAPGGKLFAIRYPSERREPAGRLLIVPPFADEMNKSRRMLALAASRLCACGWDVLIPDLFGTGDSAGEHAEATWERWIDDLEFSASALPVRPGTRLALLALRTGALLAAELLQRRRVAVDCLLGWAPCLSGEQFLKQFLRIRTMASKFAGRDETVASLLAMLAADGTVEVGGYAIGPALAARLLKARFTAEACRTLETLELFDIQDNPSGTIALPVQQLVSTLREAGQDARCSLVADPSFWASQEILVATHVIDATVEAFERIANGWAAA